MNQGGARHSTCGVCYMLNLTTEKKMIESKLKEYRSRSQNKGLTGCRTGNEMNGFCLKQDQGLKGLDGQYIHTRPQTSLR